MFLFRLAIERWFNWIVLSKRSNYTSSTFYSFLGCKPYYCYNAPWDRTISYFKEYPNNTLTDYLNWNDNYDW